MSSSHGLELYSSMNSRVMFVATPGIGRGLYMISVITSPVLRLDGPIGSRSRVNCARAVTQSDSNASSGMSLNDFTNDQARQLRRTNRDAVEGAVYKHAD